MDVSGLYLELYDRIPGIVRDVLDDLDPALLVKSPGEGINTIGWLVWHLARVEDHHIAELMDTQQLWVTGPWAPRFGLEPDARNLGFGHRPADIATVQPDGPEVLIEYLDAVRERTRGFLAGLDPGQLDRIVDRRWDPPVTLGVRLVSIADDGLQHAGQAAYAKGLLQATR